MSILSYYNNLVGSRLYKLSIGGKILGMRAKIYNTEKNEYDFYDFPTSAIKKNEKLKAFLLDNKGVFETLPLVEVKGMYVTSEELENNTIVKEFKDEESAEKVLSRFIEIYNQIEEGK